MIAIDILLIALVAMFAKEPFKWFAIVFLVSPLSLPLAHASKVAAILPEPKMRSTVLHLLLLLPTVAFAYGRFDAFLAKEGHPVRVVDVARSKLDLKDAADKRVAHLGRVGEIDVLYESLTGVIVFSKQSTGTLLFIVSKYESTLNEMPANKAINMQPPVETTPGEKPDAAARHLVPR